MLDSDVIIVGPDDGFITIDGQQQTRLFRVEPGVNAELRRLVLTGGAPGAGNAQPGEGGAIRNAGTLTISDVFLTENSTDTAAATADGGIADDRAIDPVREHRRARRRHL